MADEYDVKRDYSTDARTNMADEGEAMPDGSYPIKDEADLKNAVMAFGRAKDKPATMKHIVKRAKKLGLTEKLPEKWDTKPDAEDATDNGADEAMEDANGNLVGKKDGLSGDEAVATPEDDQEVEGKAVVKINGDGAVTSCPKGAAEGCGYKAGDKVCGKCGAMAVMTKGAHEAAEVMKDEEDLEMKGMGGTHVMPDGTVMDDAEMRGEPVRQANLGKRKAKLAKMGKKDALDGDFLCAMERKVMDEGTSPCEGCTGGCFPVKGGADLLEVEAMAEDMYDAEVVDSGYSEKYDKFVVDMRRKDGRLIEAYFTGSGESEGWHPITEDALTIGDDVIGGDEAIEIAAGSIQGKALSVGVQMFEGQVAYCVEMDGEDGYSYDVFVDTDGKVLAMDQWEYETSALVADEQKSAEQSEIEAALMEFEALQMETELHEQGLI
jgi:uncharacterized membrane protein YkoI